MADDELDDDDARALRADRPSRRSLIRAVLLGALAALILAAASWYAKHRAQSEPTAPSATER